MSTTTSAGNAATGAPATSPTATSTPADEGAPSRPQSSQERMLASLAAKKAGATSPKGVDKIEGVSPESSPGTGEGDEAATAADGAPKPDERPTEKDSVPLPAFKARIASLTAKVTSARESAAEANHAKERALAAARIYEAENERLREQLRTGQSYDERDDELADVRLKQSARERREQLDADYAAKREEAKQSVIEEEARAERKETLARSLTAALSKFDLAERSAVIAEMKANISLTAGEAARRVHDREEKRLESRGYKRAPAVSPPSGIPVGIRPPGGGSSSTGRFTNNQQGYADFLAERRKLNG